MIRNEYEQMKELYIGKMVQNLPILRVTASITQAEFGTLVGVSRQTIVVIETEKRPLTWSLYLAMLFIY